MNKNLLRTSLLFLFYIESLFFNFFSLANELQIKQDLMR